MRLRWVMTTFYLFASEYRCVICSRTNFYRVDFSLPEIRGLVSRLTERGVLMVTTYQIRPVGPNNVLRLKKIDVKYHPIIHTKKCYNPLNIIFSKNYISTISLKSKPQKLLILQPSDKSNENVSFAGSEISKH